MSPKQLTDSFIAWLIIYVVFIDGSVPLLQQYGGKLLITVVLYITNILESSVSHVSCGRANSPVSTRIRTLIEGV